jgi:lipoprotein-anchoring transpeptidase ErfK/SrfK
MRTRVGLFCTSFLAVAIGASSILTFGATVGASPEGPTTTEDSTTTTTDSSTPSGGSLTPASTTTTVLDPFGVPIPIDSLETGNRSVTTFQTEPDPTTTTTTTIAPPPTAAPTELPLNSGSGRRAVYSKSRQRVWVVDSDGTVLKTHRVSGKLKSCDPTPGTYSVFSRSRYTNSIQDPTIKWGYMVRFTKGCNGGNIGFHEIPTQFGKPVQTIAQLGQPLSGGCVRQATSDAIWMWDWAGVGTKVVVLP